MESSQSNSPELPESLQRVDQTPSSATLPNSAPQGSQREPFTLTFLRWIVSSFVVIYFVSWVFRVLDEKNYGNQMDIGYWTWLVTLAALFSLMPLIFRIADSWGTWEHRWYIPIRDEYQRFTKWRGIATPLDKNDWVSSRHLNFAMLWSIPVAVILMPAYTAMAYSIAPVIHDALLIQKSKYDVQATIGWIATIVTILGVSLYYGPLYSQHVKNRADKDNPSSDVTGTPRQQ